MCKCSETEPGEGGVTRTPVTTAGPTMRPLVPLSRMLEVGSDEQAGAGDQPPINPIGPVGPIDPIIPPLIPCRLDFREGCYQINFRPTASLVTFQGTLRVDRSAPNGGADNLIVSGDLYTRPLVIGPVEPPVPIGPVLPVPDEGEATIAVPMSVAAALSAADQPPVPLPIQKPTIPIFPRSRYHSYLKVTSVSAPHSCVGRRTCKMTLVAEQFNYTQPPAGQHKGTFPATPGRTVTMRLTASPPFPFSLTGGPYLRRALVEGGVDKGA